MSELVYPLYKGKYVNRWLVAGIFEKSLQFKPTTMSGDINQWLLDGFSIHENPCRKEFVATRKKMTPLVQFSEKILPNDIVEDDGDKRRWNIYWPWDNPSVDLSSFWFVPTYLKAYAMTYLKSECRHKAKFELRTCGGAVVWVNGQLVVDFTPFTRNNEQKTEFEIELNEGFNQVVVCFDDLAERDTLYYFTLAYQGEEKIEMVIPLGNKNCRKITKMECALAHAYFPSDTVIRGNVLLYLHNPFDEEVVFTVRVAPGEVLTDDKIQKISRVLSANNHILHLGMAEDFHMGFSCLEVTSVIEGIPMSRLFKLQIYPEKLVHKIDGNIRQRKDHVLQFIAENGTEDIHKAMAILLTNGDKTKAERLILKQLEGINKRQDCSDFYLIMLLKIWIEFREKEIFSEDLWNEIKDCILKFRYWMDEPGDDVMWFFSENHALLFHSCELIAGQIFPDEVFANSGLKGEQHIVKAEQLLLDWFERFFAEGLTEWNSSAYIPIDVLGLAALYSMSHHVVLKEKADKALDNLFYCMAINGLRGVLSCSFGRSYEKELKGNYVNAVSCLSWIAWEQGYINASTLGVVAFCLTDYTPPQHYQMYMNVPERKALVFRNTQGYKGYVNLYAYKTKNYMLSSASEYRPGHNGYQEHVLHAVFDAEAMVWINHPGELHTHGHGRPGFWAGNGSLPKVSQYRGLAIAIYDIPAGHIADYTHAYLPIPCFDRFVQYKNWFFVARGKNFAAIHAKNGFFLQDKGVNKDRELISNGYRNIWVLRIAGKEEFKSFDIFVDKMVRSPFHFGEGQEITVFDPIYGKVKVSWNEPLTVNGKPVRYKDFPTHGLVEWISL